MLTLASLLAAMVIAGAFWVGILAEVWAPVSAKPTPPINTNTGNVNIAPATPMKRRILGAMTSCAMSATRFKTA